jgi:1-acyl-sn-glycerol-3-phosphate acyltransferase
VATVEGQAVNGSDYSERGRQIRRLLVNVGAAVASYVRFEFDAGSGLPDGPALIVANHGFGGPVDLNVLLTAFVMNELGVDEDDPAVILMHNSAWAIRVRGASLGELMEPAGFRPASRAAAIGALDAGAKVFVAPGGDLDACKPWRERNRVSFHGRDGFARLAKEAGAPIIPIVITGAGDTLLNLSHGAWLARALRLDKLLRQKALPISVAAPWGLNVGLALGGYLPMPAKMRGALLDPIMVGRDDDPADAAQRVERAMDQRAHALTAGRSPYADWLGRRGFWTGPRRPANVAERG